MEIFQTNEDKQKTDIIIILRKLFSVIFTFKYINGDTEEKTLFCTRMTRFLLYPIRHLVQLQLLKSKHNTYSMINGR